jgi:hypothetical protein
VDEQFAGRSSRVRRSRSPSRRSEPHHSPVAPPRPEIPPPKLPISPQLDDFSRLPRSAQNSFSSAQASVSTAPSNPTTSTINFHPPRLPAFLDDRHEHRDQQPNGEQGPHGQHQVVLPRPRLRGGRQRLGQRHLVERRHPIGRPARVVPGSKSGDHLRVAGRGSSRPITNDKVAASNPPAIQPELREGTTDGLFMLGRPEHDPCRVIPLGPHSLRTARF